MTRTPLSQYALRRQSEVAKQLGVTQASISKAIRMQRSIFVLVAEDGTVSAVEERPFPSRERAAGKEYEKQLL
ncbi:Cro/CI family transcriptional regulator [Metapseudomonas otitidis]|uniref:Cro/CI family transcriptional regulator n=1 Tax=Metapseudomonas otitidis TaxID=319939 RepID=UPI0039FD402E